MVKRSFPGADSEVRDGVTTAGASFLDPDALRFLWVFLGASVLVAALYGAYRLAVPSRTALRPLTLLVAMVGAALALWVCVVLLWIVVAGWAEGLD